MCSQLFCAGIGSEELAVMLGVALFWVFFFQAEDGIRDLVRSRGLGDVYKRQILQWVFNLSGFRLRKWA